MSPRADPSEHRRRTVARWLTLGLVVLVAVTLGPPLLDALDAQYPWRSTVALRAAPPEQRIELSGEAPSSARARIETALAVLPRGFVRVAEAHRATIVPLTTQELNRRYPSHDELSQHAGLYDPDERVLYVAFDSDRAGRTALHEYGHLIDDALDHPSSSSAFGEIAAEARAQPRFRRYYVSQPAETFAELFARYYYSDRTRNRLRRDHPRGFAYFEALEDQHLE